MSTTASDRPDVALIGAGIMSATLGTLLKELEPTLDVAMFETLDDCAQESSEAWNNAGTGHAANCELNYTPQRSDGTVDIARALEVNTEFDISRQLWSYLVTKGAIPDPSAFLEPCPHMSFVWGEENVAFLRTRYEAMSAHHCYEGMEYSEDHGEIAEWVPLVMEGRVHDQRVAATRMITGTDVDYGSLTHLLVTELQAQPGFSLHYKHEVVDLDRLDDGRWGLTVKDLETGDKRTVSAKFVFIGAGGGGLKLLEKSNIPEGHGYGGFPVSGIWLRCDVDGVSAAMVMVCLQVIGEDSIVASAGAQGNFQLNAMRPIIINNVLHSSRILGDAADKLRRYSVEGTQLDNAKVSDYVGRSLMLVTALSPHIGYDKASAIAHKADDEGSTLREAALALGVSAAAFDRIVDPAKMVGDPRRDLRRLEPAAGRKGS